MAAWTLLLVPPIVRYPLKGYYRPLNRLTGVECFRNCIQPFESDGEANHTNWRFLYFYSFVTSSYFNVNSFVCPHDIQRVGPLSDGGKWICGMSLYEEQPRAKCVIYSFGVNYETRFEGEMLERTDCEIFAYDASVTAMGPGKLTLSSNNPSVWSLKSIVRER